MQPAVEPEIAPHRVARSTESIGRRYLCFLLMIPVVAFLFPYFVEGTQLFGDATLSRLGQILDHGYRTSSENADVVIFGDSAALYNVEPSGLSKRLHLKVINLPNTRDSLVVNGDASLRNYLSANRAPRLIVFYFCPWDLNLDDPWLRLYDGEEMLFRHGTWRQIFRFALERPNELLYFPFRFYAVGNALTDYLHRGEYHPPAVTLGHVPYEGGHPLPQDCVLPSALLQSDGSDFVDGLMMHFKTTRTATLLVLSPIPDCSHSAEPTWGKHLHFAVTPPAVRPPAEFVNDGSYTHRLPTSVEAANELLSRTITAALGRGF